MQTIGIDQELVIADREAEHEPGAEAEAGAERDTEPEAVSEAEQELGADPVREAEPPATGGVHPAGVGVLVGAGALLVSFAVFAGLSSAEDSALAERCAREACEAADVETLNTFNVVADVSWIGAATLGVVGLILLLALPPESASESRVALAPWASPDGAGLAVRGSL